VGDKVGGKLQRMFGDRLIAAANKRTGSKGGAKDQAEAICQLLCQRFRFRLPFARSCVCVYCVGQ